jgi:hypothetical protein
LKNKDLYRASFDKFSLLELMPFELFSNTDSESNESVNWLKKIEETININAEKVKDLLSYSLMLDFERNSDDRILSFKNNKQVFLSIFLKKLMPEFHHKYLDELNELELEVILKNYYFAHEIWGKPFGVMILVKSILESLVHFNIDVNVEELKGELVDLPDEMVSRLNNKMSVVGRDFSLGKKINKRSQHYFIYVGPITKETLLVFQLNGWARGKNPSPKLNYLAEMAEPYYLNAKIKFLLATKGFVIGSGVLGRDKLGNVIL